MKLSKQISIWLITNTILAFLYYISVATDQGWYVLANIYICIEFVLKSFCFVIFGACLLITSDVAKYYKKQNELEKQKKYFDNFNLKFIYLALPLDIVWVIVLFNYDFVFGATMTAINMIVGIVNVTLFRKYKKKLCNYN